MLASIRLYLDLFLVFKITKALNFIKQYKNYAQNSKHKQIENKQIQTKVVDTNVYQQQIIEFSYQIKIYYINKTIASENDP